MLDPEELYAGLSKETAAAYRSEAIKEYGKKAVSISEKSLLKLTIAQIAELKEEQVEINKQLFSLRNENFNSDKVQGLIVRHYGVTRKFWGTYHSADSQSEQYIGLGKLYTKDERFTLIEGNPQPDFAIFMNDAMSYFAKEKLA